MTMYPAELATRFAQQLADIQRRISRLEQRTAGIDSGTPVQPLPAVIDPSYTGSGHPKAFLNGAATLTGPYSHLASYTPAASDHVLLLPMPLTANTAQAGSWIILGKII